MNAACLPRVMSTTIATPKQNINCRYLIACRVEVLLHADKLLNIARERALRDAKPPTVSRMQTSIIVCPYLIPKVPPSVFGSVHLIWSAFLSLPLLSVIDRRILSESRKAAYLRGLVLFAGPCLLIMEVYMLEGTMGQWRLATFHCPDGYCPV